MLSKLTFLTIFAFAYSCHAQEKETPASPELQIIKDTVGTWDCAIEVWPAGLDAESIKMKGVESNEAFGSHWVSSDFTSEFQGQSIKVHTIVGYDLDLKKFVGTAIDYGPYAAKMIGNFDQKTKTIHWTTKVKGPDGKPIVQKSSVTYKNATERHLVLKTQKDQDSEFKKFMVITYTKRK